MSRRLFRSGEPGGLAAGARLSYYQRKFLRNDDVPLKSGTVVLASSAAGEPSSEAGSRYGGIRCDCCDQVFACSNFEVHAGAP